jgi:hypothetical protein
MDDAKGAERGIGRSAERREYKAENRELSAMRYANTEEVKTCAS